MNRGRVECSEDAYAVWLSTISSGAFTGGMEELVVLDTLSDLHVGIVISTREVTEVYNVESTIELANK